MPPLSPAALHDLADGRLPPEVRTATEAALATADAPTRNLWRFAAAWREQTRATPLPELPPELTARLRETFSEWQAERKRSAADASTTPAGWIRRVMATLLGATDLGELAPAGVRGSPLAESSRQFTFQAEGFEIVLNVCPRPGGTTFDVHGQIFPNADDASITIAAVQLISGGRALPLVAPDEFGEFLVSAVPGGIARLVLAAGDVEIITPEFDLAS